ncbi:MAG: hydroxyacid dehydrogenase [Clostridia bacterium]|nr:hydroxyacid dehydrogenase [Clostridia bacterium]
MRSVFFGDPYQIRRVYSAEVTAALEKEAGLRTDKIFGSGDIGDTDFSGVRYIFTTWGFPPMSEETLSSAFPDLKAIFYGAGSVQSFARPVLARGIKLFSAWKANAVPVIEYACSQILLANKGFFHSRAHGDVQSYDEARKAFANFPGNFGCPVGIIGAGAIGSGVIKKLSEHRLDLMVYDPFITEERAAEYGAKKVQTLGELFTTCRTISNHTANNASTKGMLTGELFAMLPKYSTFINTGRGAQIDEKGLVSVLEARKDIVAILDVTWPEPPEKGHLFYSMPNVILTPHMAGSSGNEVQRMGEYMLAEFRALEYGGALSCEVTAAMLETMA